MHFTPTYLDVGFDRMGDAMGAGLVAVLLLLGSATAEILLIAIAIGLQFAARKIRNRD